MDALICDGVRTPIGRYGGALSSVRADDLAALPIAALMARQPDLDPARIDEVIYALPIKQAKTIGTSPVWPPSWRVCRRRFPEPPSTVYAHQAWMPSVLQPAGSRLATMI